jgi:hypothetical protein
MSMFFIIFRNTNQENIMSKVYLIILTALLLTLAIGCTPTGGGTSNTTELEGTWKSDCLYEGNSNNI